MKKCIWNGIIRRNLRQLVGSRILVSCVKSLRQTNILTPAIYFSVFHKRKRGKFFLQESTFHCMILLNEGSAVLQEQLLRNSEQA